MLFLNLLFLGLLFLILLATGWFFIFFFGIFLMIFSWKGFTLIEPNEATDFEALEDTTNTVVKFPGASNDKYLGEPNND